MEYFLVSSNELTDSFAETFRERASQTTRLLVFFGEGISTDRLLARIVGLQIRTPHRFCVIKTSSVSGGGDSATSVQSFLKRLTSGLEAENRQERILDARIENGVLHVISPTFDRLDVPIATIPAFAGVDSSQLQKFEIDEDGSYIFWEGLEVHLGWAQLQQLVNPQAALNARQKSRDFNRRYGKAVQKVRERSGLKPGDIDGISPKQLKRIETGACRLTANAIKAMAQAHGLPASKYMNELAEALK